MHSNNDGSALEKKRRQISFIPDAQHIETAGIYKIYNIHCNDLSAIYEWVDPCPKCTNC